MNLGNLSNNVMILIVEHLGEIIGEQVKSICKELSRHRGEIQRIKSKLEHKKASPYKYVSRRDFTDPASVISPKDDLKGAKEIFVG